MGICKDWWIFSSAAVYSQFHKIIHNYGWWITNFSHCSKAYQKDPKSTPEASKWHPKWPLLGPQNHPGMQHAAKPEKNTKSWPKLAPTGTQKWDRNRKKHEKVCSKIVLRKKIQKIHKLWHLRICKTMVFVWEGLQFSQCPEIPKLDAKSDPKGPQMAPQIC